MSYGFNKSLETLRANCRSSNPLDCVTTYIYRASTHKTDLKANFLGVKNRYLTNIINELFCFFYPTSLLSIQETSTHKLKAAYRTFTHIFTVLSPTFLSKRLTDTSYINLTTQEPAQLKAANLTRTTALSPIKLPFFHTCIYRSSTQGSTALSNMKFTNVTVLSTIKSICNLLKKFTNSIRKVDLKLDHKKIISLDDVLFFEKEWGRKMI